MEPEQITSKRLSILNDFKEVAQLMQSCISSKKIMVSPGSKTKDVLIREILLIMASTLKPLSKITLYSG